MLSLLAGLAHLVARVGWLSVRARSVDQLLALSRREFEVEVGRLLGGLGYRQVKHVGGPGDLGMDLRAIDPQGRTVGIQCKRYASTSRVASRDMQGFVGMLVHHRLDRGLFVTTSTFTAAARSLANDHGIELVDRDALARMVMVRDRAG